MRKACDQPMSLVRARWETPIGPMHGKASPAGVVALHFPPPEQLILPARRPKVRLLGYDNFLASPPHFAARVHLETLTIYLIQYFHGQGPESRPVIDWQGMTPFARLVLEATACIAPGHTLTYGQLAQLIDRPKASRAVGGALKHNRLPLLLPCHRIVSSNPRHPLGGFSGGLGLKEFLLEHEGAATRANGKGENTGGLGFL